MAVIDIKNLNKRFGSKSVLKDINLSLEGQQIIGLLGPNGSGKTTLLKILAGALTDYDGDVRIEGHPISPKSKALVAYLPEKPLTEENWRVSKLLNYYEDMYQDFDRRKSLDMLKRFKLTEDLRIKTMSKGMKEKLSLAVLMGRNALVYLLDEPLGGVDPAARGAILEKIIGAFDEDSLMIISTHLIGDVEPVLDRVIFLKDESIFLDEEADTIRARENKSIDDYFKYVYREEGVL